MNIEAVRSLLLALDLGSLSAAADQLGVPPSTISRRVRELEAELGHEVLTRTGRGVRPAEQARDTIARLRDVLQAVHACYAEHSPITRLRITAPLEMAISLMPGLLPAFHADFPEITVELQGDDRVLGLVEGEFDLAIRAGRLSDTSYLSRLLPTTPFVLVAAPEMAARLDRVEQLAVLPTVELIGPPPGLTGRWCGTPFRLRPPVVARVDSFTAAMPLVLAGLAHAAVPLHVVLELVGSGRLVVIHEATFDAAPVHALYPRRHRQQAAVMAFIDAVAEQLAITIP